MGGETSNHIGWQLWQTSRDWVDTFVARLQKEGYPGLTLALANVLGHLSQTEGVRQTEIASRAALTKQAVGQFLDELEKLELIERIPDPEDGRARLVCYTSHGKKFLIVADRIKSEIETEYADRIGAKNLAQLKYLLQDLQPE